MIQKYIPIAYNLAKEGKKKSENILLEFISDPIFLCSSLDPNVFELIRKNNDLFYIYIDNITQYIKRQMIHTDDFSMILQNLSKFDFSMKSFNEHKSFIDIFFQIFGDGIYPEEFIETIMRLVSSLFESDTKREIFIDAAKKYFHGHDPQYYSEVINAIYDTLESLDCIDLLNGSIILFLENESYDNSAKDFLAGFNEKIQEYLKAYRGEEEELN